MKNILGIRLCRNMKSFIERFKSLKCVICNNQRLLSGAGLGAVIVLALALRLYMPINDKSIGEIDVYFWGIRTQQLESFGANNAGTSLWVFPLFMAIIHNIFGGSLYDIFLWTGPIFSAIVPTIFIYFLTKEVSSSRMAGVFAGLIYAVSPLVFYRGVFTVSETLAYALIPLNLFLAIRLYKKKNLVTFLGLLLALFLAYNEHDSAKILVLPSLLAVIRYFASIYRTKIGIVIICVFFTSIFLFIATNQSLLGNIKFFLSPAKNANNSAFGQYAIISWGEYKRLFPFFAVSLYTLFGFMIYALNKKNIIVSIILLSFTIPVLYYQQIQPRLFDTTIVPFRLTPYLTFVIAPLAAIGSWQFMRLINGFRGRNRIIASCVVFISVFPFLNLYAEPPMFNLPYVTSEAEQISLRKLPISHNDYIVIQTGSLGMTALATITYEKNYFADSSGLILAAPDQKIARQRIEDIGQKTNKRISGILISKWKLKNYDINFGWWDSLVIPNANTDLFRSSDYSVRYEDDNLVLFDIKSL